MTNTVNSQDFERAKSALAQAQGVAVPILQALQYVSTTFDFMSNATVFKAALEKDVAALQAQVNAETQRLTSLAAQSAERAALVDAAEAEAAARIREARDSVEPGVADARAQMQAQIATMREQTDARLAEIASTKAAAEKDHGDALTAMSSERSILETEIAILDKKLNSLKSSAQKFADALKG